MPEPIAKRLNLVTRYRQLVDRLKLHRAHRLAVALVGGSVVLLGIALIVLPGPAILVIPLGLTILATEFLWARRWLKRARAVLSSIRMNANRHDDHRGGNDHRRMTAVSPVPMPMPAPAPSAFRNQASSRSKEGNDAGE